MNLQQKSKFNTAFNFDFIFFIFLNKPLTIIT